MESGKDEKGRGKEGESEGRIGEGKGKGIWHTQLLGRSTATEFARVFWPSSGQILRLLPIYCHQFSNCIAVDRRSTLITDRDH